MNAAPHLSIATEATAVTPTLGLLLRKAREARGLTIDDVMQALKFSQRQIEAVEADDFAALPGNVFARGLIRSYARFLKLDPAPLLGLLEATAPVITPDVRPPDNMGSAMPHGVRQIPPLLAVSVLLLIAIATMVAWQFVAGKSGSPISSATQAPNAAPASSEVPAEKAEQAAEVPTPVLPAPVVAETAATPATTPATTVADAAPPPAGGTRVSFDFRGDSWIEVKDASGQIVLTGLFGPGRQSVAGRPPFDIVIGNAARVDVQYEGQPVDLKPHTRAEVARLILK